MAPVAETEIRALIDRLVESTEALAALGALIRLRVGGVETHDDVEEALREIVAALDGGESWDEIDVSALGSVLPRLLAVFQESLDLVSDPLRAPGWSYTDVRLLESQGAESATFPAALHDQIAPGLGDLAGRLGEPNARFLDVGVGVAGLSIAMCERWPSLTVDGLDPWAPALELARRSVAAAKLAERISLRAQRVQELDDSGAFDLAWLPAAFLSADVMPVALERVTAALRPGGWLLLAMYRGRGELGMALARLRTVRSGGAALTSPDAEVLLADTGLAEIQTLPAEAWPPAVIVAGRKLP